MQPLFLSTWQFGRLCVQGAIDEWRNNPNLLDAVEAGVAAVELDPTVNSVGLGGLPNSEGEVELDAAIIVGETLQAGAVASLRDTLPAISVARRVMEQTPHLILVGGAARQFARSQGFTGRPLLTDYTLQRWREWSEKRSAPEVVWSTEEDSHDTVCLLGYHDGKFVAGNATSGVAWKMPGRVGDTPIFGAGLYADDHKGAAAATGLGEELWRFVISHRIVLSMGAGLGAQEACEEALRDMVARKPANRNAQCAVIAIDKQGRMGAAALTEGFFAPYWNGEEVVLNPIKPLE